MDKFHVAFQGFWHNLEAQRVLNLQKIEPAGFWDELAMDPNPQLEKRTFEQANLEPPNGEVPEKRQKLN